MWAKANEDGCSHAWRDQSGDVWKALCHVEAEPAQLVETEEHRCYGCLIALGSELADRGQRVSMWIG